MGHGTPARHRAGRAVQHGRSGDDRIPGRDHAHRPGQRTSRETAAPVSERAHESTGHEAQGYVGVPHEHEGAQALHVAEPFQEGHTRS